MKGGKEERLLTVRGAKEENVVRGAPLPVFPVPRYYRRNIVRTKEKGSGGKTSSLPVQYLSLRKPPSDLTTPFLTRFTTFLTVRET